MEEVRLPSGVAVLRLDIPDEPATAKPVVISPLGERAVLPSAGVIVADYHVEKTPDWFSDAGDGSTGAKANLAAGAWLLAGPSQATLGRQFFSTIVHEATTVIPQVLDHLVRLPHVDAGRIGIAGSSTSGFRALAAMAAEPRLAAAAVVAACGDYHAFLQHSPLGAAGKQLALDPTFDRWLREHAPVSHPDRLVHGAVLMLNGASDLAVPLRCAEQSAAVFRRAYGRAGVPERYRFVAIENGSHLLGDEARHEVLTWWYQWLLPQRRTERRALP
jgi:dienelactone hydrolase